MKPFGTFTAFVVGLLGFGVTRELLAKDVITLERDTFREVQVTEVTPYTLSLIHAGGAATIPLASLRERDLAAYGPKTDRSQDARFWYERKQALLHGWQRQGGVASGQSVEQAMATVNPHAQQIAAYERQLAEEQKRADEQRAVLVAEQAKELAAKQAHEEEQRRVTHAQAQTDAAAQKVADKKNRAKQAARQRAAREKAEAEMEHYERTAELLRDPEAALRAALRERYIQQRTEELSRKGGR